MPAGPLCEHCSDMFRDVLCICIQIRYLFSSLIHALSDWNSRDSCFFLSSITVRTVCNKLTLCLSLEREVCRYEHIHIYVQHFYIWYLQYYHLLLQCKVPLETSPSL